MSKCWKIIILAIAMSFLVQSPAIAETFEWTLQVEENGSIHEVVNTDVDLSGEDHRTWQKNMGEEGITYDRVITNWEEYSQIGDGLPIAASQHNYLLWNTITLQYDKNAYQTLFDGIIHNAQGKIIISVPGIIKSTTAEELDDLKREPVAAWNVISRSEESPLGDNPVILEAIVFNGLLIGIIIIFIGGIGISIWYIRFVKRINKIIEEEYSISNIEECVDENTENE